jgi:hypothetical protein
MQLYIVEKPQNYSLGSSGKAALIRELMAQLAPFLPEDIRSADPETFVKNSEPLIRAYVDALSRITDGFRRL